jgi:potassium-transporting ATPase ATP-binding subunit
MKNTVSVYITALKDAVIKLNPVQMAGNPVMFVVEIGSLITTIVWLQAVLLHSSSELAFTGNIAVWLWITVLFANYSEVLAESRGKAQAASLKKTKHDVQVKLLIGINRNSSYKTVSSSTLEKGNCFLVETGDIIPIDGEVIEGIASVDESAVTGESAPVIRESGGDRSAVTGGTRVLSDWLIVRVTINRGEGFLDRMINLIEQAKRQKTPSEIALMILLSTLTIVFLIVCASLLPFSIFAVRINGQGIPVTITVLIALLVCLIPTTIGGLLPAIGIAGIDRLVRRNVIALSGRAIEAAGDVDVLLLDKTGTITMGNRQATRFIPVGNNTEKELARVAQLASLPDDTPEGRSIVVLAKKDFGIRESISMSSDNSAGYKFVPFSAGTRISGIEIGNESIRKGAVDAIARYVEQQGNKVTSELYQVTDEISKAGGTPLAVQNNGNIIGVIYLKDIVKGGIREQFVKLRNMGIRTIMITGDNPLTAAAIAAESGVDDFLAEATPEAKLGLIRKYQSSGQLVAMTGDGTNDAPALAQADVAVAMHAGTQAAREAANMIDLDNNPTKLIDIVETGKQLLMTRGALTTFSIANDVSKYFAIIPAAFATTYPQLTALNFMKLTTPESAVLSAVIFNAVIIILLVPLALKGVPYKPLSANKLFIRHLFIYGLGGLIAPFIGIKLIDMLLAALGIVH